MNEPRAKGISLWVMPEGRAGQELAALVGGLAARLGTATFAPHVTLLPGLSGPESQVLARARDLAAGLTPLSLRFSGIDGRDEHFRCLFLRVSASPAVLEAHRRAARCFGRESEPSFDPHLSLVYGTLEAGRKADLKEELPPLAPASFEGRRLHVWRTEGRVGEWRELAALTLGSGAEVRPEE
jgi:2'-5' RNA ligase